MNLENLYKFVLSAAECRDTPCLTCKKNYKGEKCPLSNEVLKANAKLFCEILKNYLQDNEDSQDFSNEQIIDILNSCSG